MANQSLGDAGGTRWRCVGPRVSIDLNKPIDKRIYKGTQPTCHDFNQFTAATETISLLVGFSAGQVQYLDLIKKDTSKLFNEERLIDKTKVTYLKWLPESESLFLASHASGHLYLYNVSHPCASAPPQYSLLKQGEGFAVYAAKSKAPRNPLAKWAVGEGPLNEFAFSPDGRHLACVSQDGCLRVFHFDSMLLRGLMKSYFGGLLCVCWSPDGRYVVTGGEDDLVTVWSFAEGRVVARGHGHKSWVNAVAFDPYTTRAEEERRDRGADKEHKRYHSLGNISRGGGDKPSGPAPRSRLDPAKVLGTALCPRIHEVPLLEPLVCKKIAQERLTVLLFLEDCIVTACQEGLICTWARPGKAFPDETEAQTGEGSWPRSPSKSVVEGISSQPGNSPRGTVV
ncbi:dystrophia myotonica WD repeat-containing protein [Echinops telfairi]|uniref:Dystrophia myotonica WD repeat-containing protein n=1 Tax=Echinops telfairi TaxID=9371 RepID=A0AC55DA33_ECHTE|nr:dystrophia myotonica WD repeat-containing protein [Echinops telfairi]